MGPVSIVGIVRDSLRAWRRDLGYLTLLAAFVEAPVVLAELTLHTVPGIDLDANAGLRVMSGALPVTIFGILAHHFLSGVMETVEGAERRGHDRPTLVQLAHTLPWTRLLVADLVVNLAIGIGLALLVVPGLVVGAYWAIALPLVNMERQPVVPTLRRSIRLTRGHFRSALTVWLLTAAVLAGAQEGVVQLFAHLHPSQVWQFVVHLGTDVLFLPMQSLPIVMLAFELVDRDETTRARTAEPAGPGGATRRRGADEEQPSAT